MPEKLRPTFISYSRSNKEFALQLARELKSAGFSIWLDQLDIAAGSRWDDEIERALQQCDVFLVILTSASITSENVKDEIGYAIDNRKRILPVLLEPATIPFRLRRFQYVDFTTKSYEEGIESAKQLLRNLIDSSTIELAAQDRPRFIEESRDPGKVLPLHGKAGTEQEKPQKPNRTARSASWLMLGIIGVTVAAVCTIASMALKLLPGPFEWGVETPPSAEGSTMLEPTSSTIVGTTTIPQDPGIVPITITAITPPTPTIHDTITPTNRPIVTTRAPITPSPPRLDTDRPAVWGWAGDDLANKVAEMADAGYRLDELNAFVHGQELFNAIWIRSDEDHPAVWGWERSDFDEKASAMASAGYQLREINAVVANDQQLFNAVWIRINEERPAVWGWADNDLFQKVTEMENAGYRLDELNGFAHGQELYNAIWIRSDEDRPAVWGWARADFDEKARAMADSGYRLEEINTFVINGQERFNAIWVKTDADRPALWGWERSDFDSKAIETTNAGYALLEISTYVLNDQQLFNAIWFK